MWPSSDSAVLIEILDCLMEAFSSATLALAAAKESCADSKFSLEVACSFHKASSRLYFFLGTGKRDFGRNQFCLIGFQFGFSVF